ncbi:MAG: hypothetical protein H6625_14175 [Bdellovibrionaceae bacterium]|nr:hypothetical protein [Pseudobdellovibrionaceae bacterium]
MSIAITQLEVFNVKAAMSQVSKYAVYNNPNCIKELLGKNGFSILVTDLNSTKNKLSGSITWGSSGLSYDVEVNTSGDVVILVRPHLNYDITNNQEDQIVERIFKNIKIKINNKIINPKSDFVIMKGFYLSPKKPNGVVGEATSKNLILLKNSGLADSDFITFLNKYIDGFVVNYRR